jgi:hypothetical protein
MEDWFLFLTNAGNTQAHSIPILTIWHLWKKRNDKVFNARRNTELGVLASIKDEFADWCSAQRGAHRLQGVATNTMSN